MNNHPLFQLTLVRFREFVREPEAVFWAVFFPILLTVGLGLAFRDRPLSQSTRPSADTPPMSGLPPPGRCHFRTGFRVRNEINVIEPSPRLET